MTRPRTQPGFTIADRAQLTVTVFLMALGVGAIVGALNYGLGSLSSPGSGFVPFLVGLALTVCAAVLLIQLCRRPSAAGDLELLDGRRQEQLDADDLINEDASNNAGRGHGSRLSAVPSLLVCVACFAFVLFTSETLGLLVTASVVVGVLGYLMRTSWWAAALLGFGFYGASYLIFAMWLAIPLPFGTLTGG